MPGRVATFIAWISIFPNLFDQSRAGINHYIRAHPHRLIARNSIAAFIDAL
jgi:hypothetical protein